MNDSLANLSSSFLNQIKEKYHKMESISFLDYEILTYYDIPLGLSEDLIIKINLLKSDSLFLFQFIFDFFCYRDHLSYFHPRTYILSESNIVLKYFESKLSFDIDLNHTDYQKIITQDVSIFLRYEVV